MSYALTAVLGFLPTALVTHYYDVIPRRLVIEWDNFGNITIIATRASTVLMIANVAAAIALAGLAIAIWQHRALIARDMRRAFLALNLAQIAAINLICAMIVSDALGLKLALKPMVPPALAVVLFAAGVLFLRAGADRAEWGWRAAAAILMLSGLALLGVNAVAADRVVGYYASAFALLAMAALVVPQSGR
jgi:hypothetical protein